MRSQDRHKSLYIGDDKAAEVASEIFIPLPNPIVRVLAGPKGRHAALIETGFQVRVETPGGGVRITGTADNKTLVSQFIERISKQMDQGVVIEESDVRRAIFETQSFDREGFEREGFEGTAYQKPYDGEKTLKKISQASQARPLKKTGKAIPEQSPKPPPGRPTDKIIKPLSFGRHGMIVPKTQSQAHYLHLLSVYDLVFGIGSAGTGKTFLAVAQGLSFLMQGVVKRLVVTRPAVEAGEKLGFLPGDFKEKLDPYMTPIWESLLRLMGREALEKRREKGEIVVIPIAFMRGLTLEDCYVIVDEAQNMTSLQMKMILTRLGEGGRMVVTGDPSQIDLARPQDSGLPQAVSLLEGIDAIAVARFNPLDVVRHPLVTRILKAYERAYDAGYRSKDKGP